jgi:membrane-bound lytic murein transglycosylase A
MAPFSPAASLRFVIFIIVIALLCLNSCSPPKSYLELPDNHYPLFIDDSDKDSLLAAINHQLNYLKNYPADKTITIGQQSLTYENLTDSLQTFSDIIVQEPSPFELDKIIRNNFKIYQAEGRYSSSRKTILLTGYYEPLFEGSLKKEGDFRHPLYRLPDSLIIRKNEDTGKNDIGRTNPDGSWQPYWSREEIEKDKRLAGNELVYLRDPFDAYLLHVQGSGRILLPDGTSRAIHFAGSNGRAYSSLGRLFVEERIMEVSDVSITSMREYFIEHPEQMPPMLRNNRRYIFFKWGNDDGPKGSLGEVLTPGRSVAIDHTVFPTGTFGYLVSRRPVLNNDGSIHHWQQFSRFVLPQDSGSAIKGAGRIDLFWGAGNYARTAANHMKEKGQFYFLIKKQF